jgi:hypothetical protein
VGKEGRELAPETGPGWDYGRKTVKTFPKGFRFVEPVAVLRVLVQLYKECSEFGVKRWRGDDQ